MIPISFVALLALPAYFALSSIFGLRRNIALAKKLGLPYVVVPIPMSNLLWSCSHFLWFPLVLLLPDSWTYSWIQFVTHQNRDDFWWESRYKLFDKLGDTFILVSPEEFRIYTASAEVISQVVMRRADFPKPTAVYEMLSIFGGNVVSTEGTEWRKHRKVTSPSFTEKSNSIVFYESLHQIKSMLEMRASEANSSPDSIRIEAFDTDAMHIALHVISKAGFGIELPWSTKILSTDPDPELPLGHSISFEESTNVFLNNIFTVTILGKKLINYARYFPIKAARETSKAVNEWKQYMMENFDQKRKNYLSFESEGTVNNMDVMDNLMRGSGIMTKPGNKAKSDSQLITNDEIISNAFILLIAGHETTANSLTYTAILLATERQCQSQIQDELSGIFAGKPSSEWVYERDIPLLQRSMLKAVINEQLRLFQPFTVLPKMVTSEGPRSLVIDGRSIELPAKTRVGLSAVGVHRNPKYWPHSESKFEKGEKNNLEEFVPERWLVDSSDFQGRVCADLPHELHTINEELDKSQKIKMADPYLQPPSGAFISFSEGQRACIGRKFAMVELYSVFAYILSNYTIELDVREWATDEEVKQMTGSERILVYQKAIDKARWTLDKTLKTRITLKLASGHGVPLRIVRQGSERFSVS